MKINTWQPKGTTSQVRSLRKVNNDQLAISIDDVDSDEKDKLEDEDDDKCIIFFLFSFTFIMKLI